jgi:hypothetical protein
MYYNYITIVNDDSSVVSNRYSSFTDDARVVIYDRNVFVIQATWPVI